MSDIPGCTRKCSMVFHMTGGRHKTNCDLYPWQKAVEELKYALELALRHKDDEVSKLFIDMVVNRHDLDIED